MEENFEHPGVTVDVLVFTISEGKLKIILIKRGEEPYLGKWATPGGFVQKDETLEDAAIRGLVQKTGVKDVYLEQLYTFGEPKRDPRKRIVTVAYMALVSIDSVVLKPSLNTTDVAWFDVNSLPELAFDHKEIINLAVDRLKSKVEYSNISKGLLPKKFRLSELQRVYEIILGTKLDKRNFRKKMLSLNLLKSTGEKEVEGAHRPAMLYEFTTKDTVFFA